MRNHPNSFCRRIRTFCLVVFTLGSAAMLPAALPGAAGTAATLLAGQVPAPEHPSQPERNVDGIMDNSFFVEEAYNQERGVVQHIFNGLYSHFDLPGSDADIYQLAFTQEWPVFSQAHQFSYTVPYGFVHSDDGSDD